MKSGAPKINLPMRSLRHYWRASLATFIGMALGTAVLTGALIVGDSIRGSLRMLTLERLGRIDIALASPRFLREEIAADFMDGDQAHVPFSTVEGAIILQGTAENPETRSTARKVGIHGIRPAFWGLDRIGRFAALAESKSDGAVVNASLARELGIKAGQDILLRMQKPDDVPAESVQGRLVDRVRSLRLAVAQVIPDDGIARFNLAAGQQAPLNVFVPLATLQRAIEQRGKLNAILIESDKVYLKTAQADEDIGAGVAEYALTNFAHSDDLGLKVRVNEPVPYLAVESPKLVLGEEEAAQIELAAKSLGYTSARTTTYLANSIALGENSIPYSTITAFDTWTDAAFGLLHTADGAPVTDPGPDGIYINTWVAEDIGAKAGDTVKLGYYLEGVGGALRTSETQFTVRGIIAMEGLGADPGLTPEYPGIKNAQRIRDWDPPFPVDLDHIRPKDEQYWKDHKATPKAFVSLATGHKLWSGRFGSTTAIRVVAPANVPLADAAEKLRAAILKNVTPKAAGLIMQPVKAQGLAASAGATDFSGLFIGLSFFIIASALMLVRLFFGLGVELRAREIGILMAVGFAPKRVRGFFLREGALLAVVGGAAGVALGVLYAALMIHGLRTWWVGAVGTTALHLHFSPMTLAFGLIGGVLTGLASVWFAVRSLVKADPARLLAGGALGGGGSFDPTRIARSARRTKLIGLALCAVAVASSVGALGAEAMTQAALFGTGGAAALAGLLCLLSAWLRVGGGSVRPGFAAVARLGASNARRNHARSLLTVALVASASFILAAVAANRRGGHAAQIDKNSGNGGFTLMAESDTPLLHDLNTAAGRDALALDDATCKLLDEAKVYALRLQPGEDASCLNLYKPTRPRILGAPADFIARGGFAFQSSSFPRWWINRWDILGPAYSSEFPAIADANTAMWILHSGLGKEFPIEDEAGKTRPFKFEGLLSGSPLQGEIIVSEEAFKKLFPSRPGYAFFFIEVPEAKAAELSRALEAGLSDYGFDVTPVNDRIAAYHTVENTYLSTFAALGALGLLLGTLGLAVVMLRAVLERRAEIALLRAFGWRGSLVAAMVLAENAFLLACGLAIGLGAAVLAVAPQLMQSESAGSWGMIAAVLASVFATGMAAGLASLVPALRAQPAAALRGE